MIDLPFERVFGEIDATGAIIRDVPVCAFTGRPDAPVMVGVPGTRLFYRLSGLAARTLSDEQRKEIERAGQRWAKPRRAAKPVPAHEELPGGPAPKVEDDDGAAGLPG